MFARSKLSLEEGSDNAAIFFGAIEALVDVWMMMFDDRYPLDLKTYFDAHLELVLNGLLAKP